MSLIKEINRWLDNPVVTYPSDPYKPNLGLGLEPNSYYTNTELKRFYCRETSKIKIDERTRRNDANNIFCELVDYCAKYEIYDNDKLLINPSNKNSFYHFIYSNSLK